jgi:neutral ceramidase
LISERTWIPVSNMIVAATHTHSGPAALGIFNPAEAAYVEDLVSRLAGLVEQAAHDLRPALAGTGSGREETISHYRRLLADDGHVVMNWEPFPAERLRGPLGDDDPEVGVLKVVEAADPGRTIALLFNHAGHPNVLSGDSYLLSAEYPGVTERLLEREFGGLALFINGAQGSVDIDGLKHRDWEGMERAGCTLAESVVQVARGIQPTDQRVCGGTLSYDLPARRVTDEEWTWAQEVLRGTGGAVQALQDGVGDDYTAVFLRQTREAGRRSWTVEQVCVAIGDTAFLSFPGELYTEIGLALKVHSPFRRTYVAGLANGYIGYIPTDKAIGEGGYAEDMRWVHAGEEIVQEQSLALLRQVHSKCEKE